MRIAGAVLIVLGLLFCLSFFGAIVGIPLILIGLVMVIAGGRRKTVITNVVQVSNNGPAPQLSMNHEGAGWRPEPTARREPVREPRIQAQSPRPALPQRDIELDLGYDTDFVDMRSELTQTSKRILAMAKEDGYQFRAQPGQIVITKGDYEETLRSNHAIEQFGRAMRYL